MQQTALSINRKSNVSKYKLYLYNLKISPGKEVKQDKNFQIKIKKEQV